jgi:uncharacterized protein (TIGR02594 family)
MAGRPQVSIRLGTTGRGEVERDFAAIGDSGEAQARRYQSAWERASAEAERALDKQAKAAARMASVQPTSAVQQTINQATGVGSVQGGSAKAAAAALAAELDHAEAEARQLIAAIDPLFAAQSRYAAQITRINAVRATGQLDEERYQQLLAHEKVLLDQATAAGARNAGMRGQMRMGAQQLGFQMNDVASQMAMGTRASVIFAQQSAQVVQALQLMGGEGNAFLKFLGGPWGIALSVAVVALTPFIGKMFEAGESIDDLVDKLKKEARQQADNDNAHQIFAKTLDGVTDALRRNRDALKGMQDQGKTAAETALDNARAQLAQLRAIDQSTHAMIAQARAQLELNNARAGLEHVKGTADPALVAADQARDRLNALEATLPQIAAQVREAQSQIADAASHVAVEAGTRDAAERIKRLYEGPDGLIEQTRKRLLAEKATTAEIERQVRALHDVEAAKIKDAQERERKPPTNAGGSAIFNDQISAYFDTAAKYRGMSETGNKGVLEAFFREANQQLDPQKTAWCAAFVNAVLAANGAKGTGSLAAASFLNFGKDDTKSPQRGDIVVVKSSASPSGQHVGFLDSIDAKGNVRVLGGNTGNKVGTLAASAKDVLAIRRPPTPAESAAADDRAASDALRAQDTFDSERARLNDQLLRELGKIALGYEAQSTVQLRVAQADHDSEATAIATNLAQGKYGDATSQLAQTRAQQLQQANDDLLKERQAAIALDSYVKTLQAQDASNERAAQYQVEDLQARESQLKTIKERRDLELKIIDLQFDEKKKHLEYLKALADLAGNTAEAARIQDELNRLPKEKAHAQQGANDNNKSPFEAYRDSLPTLGQAGENTETTIVDGLKRLNEGLDDALLKSKNFKELWSNIKGVFHDVAMSILKDLIDMAIKMFIIRPIMNLITGGAGGTPAFATGTEYFGGGAAWVGEHGPELVRLPRGSKVHTAADSRRLAAANDRGPMIGNVTIQADFRGADPAAVGAISQRIDQLEQNFSGMVVATMGDARDRFLWRGR